jgi:hypothetical protein
VSLPELLGRCRLIGYCDCGGKYGCHDPEGPQREPMSRAELRNAM